MPRTQESRRLRRIGAACAGMVAALAAIPAVTATHHHSRLALFAIGVQAVLLVIALTLLAKAKKIESK